MEEYKLRESGQNEYADQHFQREFNLTPTLKQAVIIPAWILQCPLICFKLGCSAGRRGQESSCQERRKKLKSGVLIFYLFYINGFITKRNYDVNFMYHSLTRFYTKPSRTQD